MLQQKVLITNLLKECTDINPIIIQYASTFLGVNQSSSFLLLFIVVIISTLVSDNDDDDDDDADASVLSFLMALTKSHIPPIPVVCEPNLTRLRVSASSS